MNWIGGVLVVMSGYLFGKYLSEIERDKLKAIEALLDFLGYMRRKMLYERIELYSIFCDYSDEYLEKVGFLSELRFCNNGKNKWETAIKAFEIEDNVYNELKYFGESLGILPIDEQIKRLDSCCISLEETKNKLKSSIPPKQKSIKTVCLLFGLMTAIILL